MWEIDVPKAGRLTRPVHYSAPAALQRRGGRRNAGAGTIGPAVGRGCGADPTWPVLFGADALAPLSPAGARETITVVDVLDWESSGASTESEAPTARAINTGAAINVPAIQAQTAIVTAKKRSK